MGSQHKGKAIQLARDFSLITIPPTQTRFHVASLTDGKIHPVVYESDPFFTFHHINAYEEDGQIVVDVSAYDRGDVGLVLL